MQNAKCKMQNYGIILLMLLCFCVYGTSISDIMKEPKSCDGKMIIIDGEVIRKLMKRGNLYLLNISDGTITIGVFIDKMPKIRYYGKYGVMGDRVRVSGKFNLSCKKHWGKMDIHGLSMEVLEKGKLQEKLISKERMLLLLALSLGAILLIIIHRRKNARD